ncbi:MAG: hypothetical protein H0Z24_03050 [Thermosipho sp. (in: Bacteria)]|nr:hypothetical protein [Thermosipho sp. (in: thermotogales)]
MDGLLTQDNEISVSKSPFAAYRNERMVYDGRLTEIPIHHIMMRVKRGHVYGVDFVIMEALSELEFATSRMVTQYLRLKNIDISQIKVQNRLKFMNKLNIITRFKFESDEGKSMVRVYCIERAAKYLLQSRNYECHWKPTDNTRPIDTVKEILARNQVLLTYRTKLKNLESYKVNPSLRLIKSGKHINCFLRIDVKAGKEKETILFEPVRSFDGYKDKFLKRMKQYQEFYEYFRPSEDMPTPPQLVILGEDDKHLFELFKILYKNNIQFKGTNVIYTTDLRVLSNELNKSFVRFSFVEEGESVKAKITVLNYTILQ